MTIPRSIAQKSIYFLLQKSYKQERDKYKINHSSFSNFVQIFAQDLHMLVSTTYPKFSL
jgi:hypothetical protein